MSIVISLCDLTGNMVAPWVEAGYRAVLVDPQHVARTRNDGQVRKIAGNHRGRHARAEPAHPIR